jgi:hypothetical protein
MSNGKCSQYQLPGVPWSGHHEAVEYREWVLRMQHMRSEIQSMSDATLVLDIEALRKITGYAHWLPALRGISQEFINRHYPGWDWNDILPVLVKKGIVKRYSSDPDQRKLSHDLSISHEIESLQISRTTVGKKVVIQTSCVKTKLRRIK